jgi:hypothetical protein
MPLQVFFLFHTNLNVHWAHIKNKSKIQNITKAMQAYGSKPSKVTHHAFQPNDTSPLMNLPNGGILFNDRPICTNGSWPYVYQQNLLHIIPHCIRLFHATPFTAVTMKMELFMHWSSPGRLHTPHWNEG